MIVPELEELNKKLTGLQESLEEMASSAKKRKNKE